MYFSKTKATTAKIRSQVCSARKPTALAAVLKRKLATWPISPGSREPSFAAISLSPPAIAFPVAFKPLVRALITVPIVTPAASRMAVTVTPFFFEYLFDPFAERHGLFSFRDLCLQTRDLFDSFFYSVSCSFFF